MTLCARLSVCFFLLFLIGGCREDSTSPEGGVQVTKSVEGVVRTKVGQTQTIGITFSAADATPLFELTIASALQSLPAGWSGPASFSCASITSTSHCILNLTYAPIAVASGTLTLDYSYRTASGDVRTNSTLIDFRGTVTNTVGATVGPSQNVKALAGGGSQAVIVTFNSDDGNAATALDITTNLAQLPDGWISASPEFECDEVNTGNGCQLLFTFAPTNVDSGTLVLDYRYDDNSDVAKTGSVSIDYAGTSHNNLLATAAPSGQVNAPVGAGARNVTVTFTTDDGHPASNILLTTNLSSLPAGWASATPSFGCANASIGNDCELALTYTPSAVDNGTLVLQYSFDDNSGAAHSGSVNIPYVATSNNSVAGTASPTGQITVAAGASQPVTVTFNTDDGNPASALSITSDLSALPAGWSTAAPTFNCTTVASGSGCALTLSYEPLGSDSGTLSLNYAYTNHAGAARTGSVTIPYQATSEHVYAGQFWAALSYCAINSNGTLSNCADTGIAGMSGIAFTGNRVYLADYYNSIVHVCSVAADGSLSGCVNGGGTFFYPFVLTISGNVLYVANGHFQHTITYCTIDSSGSLTNCAETTSLQSVEGLAAANGYVYASRPHSNAVDVCQQNGDGSLSNCITTGSGFSGPEDLVISGNRAYVTNTSNNTVSTCDVSAVNGTLSSCTTSPVGGAPMGIALKGSQAYISTRYAGIYLCNISGTGALTNCALSNGGATFGLIVQIAVH